MNTVDLTVAGYGLRSLVLVWIDKLAQPNLHAKLQFFDMVSMLSLTVLLIPLVIRFTTIKSVNTSASVIFAYSAITLPYSIWLLKGFIDTIPKELEEAVTNLLQAPLSR